ncbi:GntR family transcriptional regulator [Humidisolicoccus flavus]|uniref:GntR family transcriptional regulator n=1 Tax=Humidisolicoccus flavus TaxID=3111414 RepID=UPI0032481AFC
MSSPREHVSAPVLSSLGEHLSIRARVTEVLREAMVVGDMKPGEVYSAPALAQNLGVSPTPVREAMIDLAQEGLVEAMRNRGYLVVTMNDSDLDEILELRALIEVPTIARVAEIATAEQVAALRPLADELNRTAEAGLLREFIAADSSFHLQLLGIAGNERLVQEVRRLRGFSRLSALRQLHEDGHLTQTAAEHEQLLDLIAAHDGPGAAALMSEHLAHVRGIWAGLPEE